MKSSPLHSISPLSVVPRIRLSRSFAALFAAALAMGLGAQSVLAQGPYYPQVAPLGGAPFVPNGFPVISNPELNLIETNMPAGKTLVIPAAPKAPATLADYKLAVQAAATAVSAGPVGGVSVGSLAAEVAKYRQVPSSQVADGLRAIADGVIASGVGLPAKQTLLEDLARNAAKVDPAGATSGGILAQVFTAAAANNTLVTGVAALVNNALQGAGSGTPPPVALTSAGVKTLVANAVSAIANAPTANAATADNAAKGVVMRAMATAIMNGPTIAGSSANIDQASSALVSLAAQPYSMALPMIEAIRLSGVLVTKANYGAIAQGALRGNYAAASDIKTALNTGAPVGVAAYTDELVDAFVAFNNAGEATARGAGATDPAAVAAAGVTKFGASAPAIVRDVLIGSGASGTVAQDVISRGVAAAIGTPAQNIATAAVTAFPVTPARLTDVTIGAITGAPISSAGTIAKAVIAAGGLTAVNAAPVGSNAIAAAASISPANVADAYADIAYNLSDAVKGAGAGVGNAAVAAEVAAILAVPSANKPTYIAVVAAAAGAPANRATILSAGTGPGAGGTGVGGGAVNDTAAGVGVGLLGNITNVPLSNYQATLNAVTAAGGIDANNLAVLYAASLANPGDAAGSLAALIAKTGTLPADLTAAAVSANRSKQTGLTIASAVAVYAKLNPTADIQISIGHQILDNPTYVKEISSAVTVVLPQFSHNIAHAVAFNQPKTASDSVAGIFLHSRITNTVGVAGIDKLAIGDRAAAGAAITAALTTGILESTQLLASERTDALKGIVVEAVKALVNPLYNDTTAGAAAFRQSNGVTAASFTLVKAKGVAGGITGFTAQMVKSTDVAVDPDALNALFQASYNAGILTGTTYQLDIAQAAAQAFGWITGIAASPAVVTQISNAVFTGYPVGSLTSVQNAVAFGLSEGAGHVNGGAGAGGLREGADPFYTHRSASGRPVSNIFSL